MLQKREAEGSVLRLIVNCFHVGFFDGGAFVIPDEGTVQGSTLSPLLGNVYLHYVLDLWFTEEVKPRMRGKVLLVRYADDVVFGFELRDDAERFRAVLEKRLARFGLNVNPDKTRLLDFRPPPKGQKGGKGRSTFDFLGFTWYWRRTRRRGWMVTCKTRRARLSRAIRSAYDCCRSHRHLPVKAQHTTLVRRIRGHFNYFGVSGNIISLKKLAARAKRAWFKWLNRRSQRSSLTWDRYIDLLRDFPLPKPRIVVNIWR